MTAGQFLTLDAVRVAAVLYFLSVAAWLIRRDRAARILWTIACGFYLLHVASAFQFYHHWSHAAAYAETARQTAQVFGIDWGGGLYFNYAFTVIWIADAIWWWQAGLVAYRERRRMNAAVHWFLAFMFFNATVVFASGWTRWTGVAATLVLLMIAAKRRALS